jgi:hypothetical protein
MPALVRLGVETQAPCGHTYLKNGENHIDATGLRAWTLPQYVCTSMSSNLSSCGANRYQRLKDVQRWHALADQMKRETIPRRQQNEDPGRAAQHNTCLRANTTNDPMQFEHNPPCHRWKGLESWPP